MEWRERSPVRKSRARLSQVSLQQMRGMTTRETDDSEEEKWKGILPDCKSLFTQDEGSESNPGDKELIPSGIWSISRFIFHIILNYLFGTIQLYDQMLV